MAVQRKPIYQAEEIWARKVIQHARAILSRKRKNASKELYNSLRYVITSNSIQFSYAKQGEFVESGRRKGAKMPPMAALEKWAKQKGLAQFRSDDGKYLSSKARAYLIGRAISKNGIKPLAWFSDPLEQALRELPKAIEEAIVIVINGEITKIVNSLDK